MAINSRGQGCISCITVGNGITWRYVTLGRGQRESSEREYLDLTRSFSLCSVEKEKVGFEFPTLKEVRQALPALQFRAFWLLSVNKCGDFTYQKDGQLYLVKGEITVIGKDKLRMCLSSFGGHTSFIGYRKTSNNIPNLYSEVEEIATKLGKGFVYG